MQKYILSSLLIVALTSFLANIATFAQDNSLVITAETINRLELKTSYEIAGAQIVSFDEENQLTYVTTTGDVFQLDDDGTITLIDETHQPWDGMFYDDDRLIIYGNGVNIYQNGELIYQFAKNYDTYAITSEALVYVTNPTAPIIVQPLEANAEPLFTIEHTEFITALAVTDKYIYAGTRDGIYKWDVITGQLNGILEGSEIGIPFSLVTDGEVLLSQSVVIDVYDLNTHEVSYNVPWLGASSLPFFYKDMVIWGPHFYDLDTKDLVYNLYIPEPSGQIAISSDGTQLAVPQTSMISIYQVAAAESVLSPEQEDWLEIVNTGIDKLDRSESFSYTAEMISDLTITVEEPEPFVLTIHDYYQVSGTIIIDGDSFNGMLSLSSRNQLQSEDLTEERSLNIEIIYVDGESYLRFIEMPVGYQFTTYPEDWINVAETDQYQEAVTLFNQKTIPVFMLTMLPIWQLNASNVYDISEAILPVIAEENTHIFQVEFNLGSAQPEERFSLVDESERDLMMGMMALAEVNFVVTISDEDNRIYSATSSFDYNLDAEDLQSLFPEDNNPGLTMVGSEIRTFEIIEYNPNIEITAPLVED